MKSKNVLPCVVTVTNDETEVFMEMAINNFRKHLQVMIDCMGNDYERHFKNRRYIEEVIGFAPIFPDTCYHLTHYWPAAVDIPVASDIPVHYADAIRYNARTPLQGSLLPLTRLV